MGTIQGYIGPNNRALGYLGPWTLRDGASADTTEESASPGSCLYSRLLFHPSRKRKSKLPDLEPCHSE